MADYTGFVDDTVLTAALLNGKTTTPINEIGGDDLEDGIVKALTGPNIQFTIGAEAADVIRVTLQVEKHDGVDITLEAAGIYAWLADSATTPTLTAAAPSGGFGTAVTGFKIEEHTANKSALLLTDATGTFAMDITHTGATTWYLWTVCGARKQVSAAITFV